MGMTEPLSPRADALPTVTVVIPARNEERILERCLLALERQLDPADEIVVVDNGSDDGTAAVAAGFGRTRVISEPRPGITYARTAGFDAARGEVIARIDADSLVRPDWVRRLREAFASAEVDAVGGGAAIAELSPGDAGWFTWWYRGFRLWHQRSIGVSPMLYGFNSALRREAWLAARPLVAMGDERVSEDVDVTIALLRTGHRLRFDPRLVVRARLFRSLDGEKLARYYRTDGMTLARHRYGRSARWLDDETAAARSDSGTAPLGERAAG
jgi:glycosyltransferase involved in cell wall biosynthesis